MSVIEKHAHKATRCCEELSGIIFHVDEELNRLCIVGASITLSTRNSGTVIKVTVRVEEPNDYLIKAMNELAQELSTEKREILISVLKGN